MPVSTIVPSYVIYTKRRHKFLRTVRTRRETGSWASHCQNLTGQCKESQVAAFSPVQRRVTGLVKYKKQKSQVPQGRRAVRCAIDVMPTASIYLFRILGCLDTFQFACLYSEPHMKSLHWKIHYTAFVESVKLWYTWGGTNNHPLAQLIRTEAHVLWG